MVLSHHPTKAKKLSESASLKFIREDSGWEMFLWTHHNINVTMTYYKQTIRLLLLLLLVLINEQMPRQKSLRAAIS